MKIVLVEDNRDLRKLWEIVFPTLGHELTTYTNGYEAIKQLDEWSSVSLIITDYYMPGMTGAEFAAIIQHLYPNKVIFFVTGSSESSVGSAIAKIPNSHLFIKPVDIQTLKDKIEELFSNPST